MLIPETLVIGIHLHGEIHLNKNGYPNKEKIPDGMRLNIINAVAPGVSNISTLQVNETMAQNISTIIDSYNINKLTKYKTNILCNILKNMLVETNKIQSTNIIKEYQDLYNKNIINPTFQDFVHQYGNSFKINSYETNEFIYDKIFIKFSDGQIINPHNYPENYVNNIVLYNLEGKPDLFDILQMCGLEVTHITIGQIMEFLVNLGVKNLVIIDLSCSVFKGDSEFLSKRNIRQLRRQMISQ